MQQQQQTQVPVNGARCVDGNGENIDGSGTALGWCLLRYLGGSITSNGNMNALTALLH